MQTTHSLYLNPLARTARLKRPTEEVRQFHSGLPGYEPTPLIDLPSLAAELGVGRVLMKDESARLGLPAFKILGASYAIARALSHRWGSDRTLSLADLQSLAPEQPAVTLFAATDGNHGRAVARTARLLGIECRIFYPATLTTAAMAAIADEGADTRRVELPYDDVVAEMRAEASRHGESALIIQDTAWAGYDEIPSWIVDGYSTMLSELDEQLAEQGITAVDLALAPAGVGSLAQAIVTHFKSGAGTPAVAIVEPATAPAVFAALTTGVPEPVTTADTVMLGLNCGTVSELAWPVLRAGADAAVLVSDDDARAAVATLQSAGVDAGPCGAATLAGARRLASAAAAELSLTEASTVVLFNTESLSANPL
ncbi:diaminopropionate ammonia-lyase [Leucobacter sp. NPDC015123]|uniref:diaminopropionate ammonia-lyase n=1 Tax=Leucobacter sp. NPDC015123 TaxID=3364129 RepID=UPI0036F49037